MMNCQAIKTHLSNQQTEKRLVELLSFYASHFYEGKWYSKSIDLLLFIYPVVDFKQLITPDVNR